MPAAGPGERAAALERLAGAVERFAWGGIAAGPRPPRWSGLLEELSAPSPSTSESVRSDQRKQDGGMGGTAQHRLARKKLWRLVTTLVYYAIRLESLLISSRIVTFSSSLSFHASDSVKP